MAGATTVYESNLAGLPLLARGKVRDMYAVGDDHLLIVTTDRLSAFDVVLPDPIPGKGQVLTTLANFWFDFTKSIVPNHLTPIRLDEILSGNDYETTLGRGIVVKKLQPLPIEAVVRGYLIGSGWKDYQATGAVCGIALPAGLRQADRLPEPIFTPASKAEAGSHDENISFAEVIHAVGEERAAALRKHALDVYQAAAVYAAQHGIIIADTKFEFGLDSDGQIVLMDEVLTPDSSRFWPLDTYTPGASPPSYDKQFIRDYLETLTWQKAPPAPRLPADIIDKTAAKYREALHTLVPDFVRYEAR